MIIVENTGRISKKMLLNKMAEIEKYYNIKLEISEDSYFVDRYKDKSYKPKYAIITSDKRYVLTTGSTFKVMYDYLDWLKSSVSAKEIDNYLDRM